MTCPFLKESHVRYCGIAPARKMIPEPVEPAGPDRCSSPEHALCPLFQGRREGEAALAPCPYRRDALVQYCAAAPVTRFIPYSDALTSRCATERYLGCPQYASWAEPAAAGTARAASAGGAA